MEMVVLFLVLITFAVAAPRYGVDSRAEPGYPRTTPAADLAALRCWLSQHRNRLHLGAGSS